MAPTSFMQTMTCTVRRSPHLSPSRRVSFEYSALADDTENTYSVSGTQPLGGAKRGVRHVEPLSPYLLAIHAGREHSRRACTQQDYCGSRSHATLLTLLIPRAGWLCDYIRVRSHCLLRCTSRRTPRSPLSSGSRTMTGLGLLQA